jgi:hypothetical protein
MGISFAPGSCFLSDNCLGPATRGRCCRDAQKPARDIEQDSSWLCSRGRALRSGDACCFRAIASVTRSCATDQVSDILACCMITFTFRRSTLTALKEDVV